MWCAQFCPLRLSDKILIIFFLFYIVVDSFSDSFPLRLYKVLNIIPCAIQLGFPGGSAVKNLPANEGDIWDGSSIPGLGRCPGEGNGKLLQYSCPGSPMDRGAWQASQWGHKWMDTMEWLSMLYNRSFLFSLCLLNPDS